MIIYKITNLINNKVYIGQTTQLIDIRWKQHCQLNRKRSCHLIQNAIKKYGQNNFNIEQIDTCLSKEELNIQEKYWILKYQSFGPKGYNLTTGGDHVQLSSETIAKISKSLKNRPSLRKGIPSNRSAWNKGKSWSVETKNKMSIAHKNQISWCKGKKLTKEHCKKLSESHKGKINQKTRKSIICLNTGIKYDSLKAASKQLNLQASKICLVLKGRRTHTKGFKFIYEKFA
jgi:group I intron endonuclease